MYATLILAGIVSIGVFTFQFISFNRSRKP